MDLLSNFDFSIKIIPNKVYHHWSPSFTPEKRGFASIDDNNVSFLKNIKSNTHYYLKKMNYEQKWIFRIISNKKEIIMHEIIDDSTINERLNTIFRSDRINEIIKNIEE